jgi:hypothetical protein
MKLIALKNQSYDRKRIKKGDIFNAKDKDAGLLIIIGAAKEYKEPAKAVIIEAPENRSMANTTPKRRGRPPKSSYQTKAAK